MAEMRIVPEAQKWDLIIVGTGMGGATLGHTLAKKGLRVLFCERGRSHLHHRGSIQGDYAEMFFSRMTKAGMSHEEVLQSAGRRYQYIEDISHTSGETYIPFLGQGTGGSSALYGTAMERFSPEDFSPGQFYRQYKGSMLPPAWPIRYEELVSYYRKAESLYRVRGEPDPLGLDKDNHHLGKPPPLGPANRALFQFLINKGLHPYRLPAACEFAEGCSSCQGFLCTRNCKNDSSKICLEPAVTQHSAILLDECTVDRLETSNNRVTTVECVWRGKRRSLKADRVVLAAGALVTPLILLRSSSPKWPDGLANGSGLVGRNLMRHYIDLYALFQKLKPQPGENTKEIAFNDYYVREGMKFGTVQSFGWLPPAAMVADDLEKDIRSGPLPIAARPYQLIKPLARWILDKTLCRSLVLVSTMEDLPYRENRVFHGKGGRVAIEYRVDEMSRKRIAVLREIMAATLKPWRYLLIKQAENNQRLAHVCGTCRMGDDPDHSVIDRFNRTHEVENLYIVDASFFPTSGGTNPSLTIAANALRVADHILGQ